MLVTNNPTGAAILTQLLAVGGPLNGVKVALFSAGPTPGPGNVLTDFTLTLVTGCGPKVLTFSAPYLDADGSTYIDAYVIFVATDAVHPETELGWLIVNSAATALVGGDKFPTPIPLLLAGAVCQFVLRFRIVPQNGAIAVIVP